MSNVIALSAHPRVLNAIRQAVNERARSNGASDDKRRHALGVAFDVMRTGGSSGLAVAQGCRDLRESASWINAGPGPAAA